jgi:hypothetical protein
LRVADEDGCDAEEEYQDTESGRYPVKSLS